MCQVTFHVNPDHAEMLRGKILSFYIFPTFFIFYKTYFLNIDIVQVLEKNFLMEDIDLCMLVIVSTDNLVMQGARSSAAMVLTQFSWSIPTSVP